MEFETLFQQLNDENKTILIVCAAVLKESEALV